MDRCGRHFTLVIAALLLATCQASPQPSPTATPIPTPAAVVEFVPMQMLAIACQPMRLEARIVGAAAASFRVTFVCTTCTGGFGSSPAPQPAPETAATFDRVAADRYRADIRFPRGGTWRVQTAEIEIPNPRPIIQVLALASSPCV